jgi:Transcriptional regulatory protein, C terminal
MWSIDRQTSWHSLLNPFTDEQPHVIAGHVSCRSTEIRDIIAGRQNALILAGRPNIGKSTLIRYLQLPPTALWSWRNELEEGSDTCERLDAIHFVQIDLKPLLVDFKLEEDKLLDIFIRECTRALYQAYKPGETFSDLSLSGLYKLLALISDDATDETRYFLVLDNIERLGSLYMQHSNIKNDKKKPQEYGITLLDRCRAIRTIIDLIDEFKLFGFILSIESLPRARVVDQFTYISADLARFTTRTLQTFTLSDTRKFLAQHIRDFENGANTRNGSNSDLPDTSPLFSAEEQLLLLNLAGTHPHLLQQCCYYLFQFKAHSVQETGRQDKEKEQLRSIIDEQVSTFLSRTWKRLQEAITNSTDSGKVEKQFQMFLTHCITKKAEDTIDLPFWDSLDPELRYILYSEGIVRYDLFRPVQFPGEILRDYLVQQVKGKTKTSDVHLTPVSSEHNHWLHITRPGAEPKSIPLSKLEYRLLNTLLQNHRHCTEQKLIESAWEKGTERANFTQRLHKLRKKLEEQLDGIDIIENRYGGIYSLVHADWLQLD